MPFWKKVDGSITAQINNLGQVTVTAHMNDSDFILVDTTSEEDYGVGWNPIGTNDFFTQLFDTGGPRFLGNVGSQLFPQGAEIFMSAKAYTKPKKGWIKITRYRKFKNTIQFTSEVTSSGNNSTNPSEKPEWLIPVLHQLF